jgi:hypothetical protein
MMKGAKGGLTFFSNSNTRPSHNEGSMGKTLVKPCQQVYSPKIFLRAVNKYLTAIKDCPYNFPKPGNHKGLPLQLMENVPKQP